MKWSIVYDVSAIINSLIIHNSHQILPNARHVYSGEMCKICQLLRQSDHVTITARVNFTVTSLFCWEDRDLCQMGKK